MKIIYLPFLATILLCSCYSTKKDNKEKAPSTLPVTLAEDVKNETFRTWEAYAQYAWPHDGLLPISKTYHDWYAQSNHILKTFLK